MTSQGESETVGEALSSLAGEPAEKGPVLAPQPRSPAGPPAGFGYGVNEYLNHYVAVADAKAAGFLAAALTVGAAAVKLQPTATLSTGLYWLSLALLAAAVVTSAIAIFPRLPHTSSKGLIFFEEIRAWTDTAAYQRALAETTAQDIEFEYAAQNRAVSRVLHEKHIWVRSTVWLLVAGTAVAVLTFLSIRHA